MSEITVERRGATAWLTLDAPERRNALSRVMAEELLAALTEIDRDPEVGVTVISGAEGHFCAGAERSLLADAGSDPAGGEQYAGLGLVYEVFAAVDRLATPTIAALQGWSVGAGVNLALATDVRVIGEGATLRSGFSKISIHPGGGHFTLISRAANREAAVAMSLLCQDVRGADAVRLGLAWECVPDDQVLARCGDLAETVTDPELTRASIANLRHETTATHLDVRAATQLERSSQMWSLRRRHQG